MISKLLNFGIDSLPDPERDLRFLQRSNFFVLFVFCLVPIFIPIFLWVGAGWHSWLLTGVSLNVILVYLLNGKGYSMAGRVTQLISFCGWLVYFCWLLGRDSGIQHLFLVFVTMPFVFFPSRLLWLQLVVVVLYALGFILVDINIFNGPMILEGSANVTFKIIVETLVFFWLSLNFYYLNYTSDAFESKLYNSLDKLEKANKEAEQFVYIASHDLQEPLRSAKSFVAHTREEGLSKEGQTYVDYAEMLLSRMQSLIEALMNYGRLGLKSKLEFTDVRVVLSNIKTDLSQVILEGNATIEVGEMPVLNAYKTEFRLLLQNLISNAIKFKREDVNPEINIQAEKLESEWCFSVKDNGIGVDQRFHDKIFRIFQRLHTRESYDGLGIGLAHCRKIVDLHEGKIWLESEPGKGSTFYFTIPIKK